MPAKKKVYVSDGYNSYASWLEKLGWRVCTKRENADLILFAGGQDIDPSLYGVAREKSRFSSKYLYRRDKVEKADWEFAQKNGIKTFGTCRGIQLITCLNGGTLIQDINHPGGHSMYTFDHQKLITNSLHHQMCNPFNLPKEDYHILAWCPKGFSSEYTMYNDPNFEVPEDFLEPELIFYPKTNSIGMQGHPESLWEESLLLGWVRDIFVEFWEDTLLNHINNVPAAPVEPFVLPKENERKEEKLALPVGSSAGMEWGDDNYAFDDF